MSLQHGESPTHSLLEPNVHSGTKGLRMKGAAFGGHLLAVYEAQFQNRHRMRPKDGEMKGRSREFPLKILTPLCLRIISTNLCFLGGEHDWQIHAGNEAAAGRFVTRHLQQNNDDNNGEIDRKPFRCRWIAAMKP